VGASSRFLEILPLEPASPRTELSEPDREARAEETLPLPRVEELVPRSGALFLDPLLVVLRDELPLDRGAEREEPPERAGGSDLRELDPELPLLPELFDDDEGGDFLRLVLPADADSTSITSPSTVSSASVSFGLDSLMIESQINPISGEKTINCRNSITYHYSTAIVICQLDSDNNKS
jgi:hypothetical protein